MKTIGPQVDGHSLGQSRSLESETSTLTDQEKIPGSAPFISLVKQPTLDKDLISSDMIQTAVQESQSQMESTVRACIASIEDALLKFEQSGTTSKEDARIDVHIEVQKDNVKPSGDAQVLPNHWRVMSIVRKDGAASPQASDFLRGKSSESAPGNLEEVNDPYIPNPKNNSSEHNQRVAALQAQIDQIVGVMHDNMNHAMLRGEKSDNLQDKTDILAAQAQAFRRGASRVRKGTPWFVKAWNSLPSTEDAVNSIQNSLPSPAATMASFRQ